MLSLLKYPFANLKNTLSQKWAFIVLLMVFGLSRAFYALKGVRFDANLLPRCWQYIDSELLVSNFCRSIFYLHSQPPAMNLFLGLILRFFPGSETTAFWGCYLTLGITLTICLYLLLKNLGLVPPLAVVLTTLFVVSPACVLDVEFISPPVAGSLRCGAICI